MPDLTSLGLTKPEVNEYYDLGIGNVNLDLLDQLIAARIEKAMIANNLLSDNPNTVLAAPQGKALKGMIDTLNDNLTTVINNFVGQQDEYRVMFDAGGSISYSTCIPVLNAKNRTITIQTITGVGFDLSWVLIANFHVQKFTNSIALYTEDASTIEGVKGKLVAFSFTVS
jgi:hypothetical protein